MKIGFNLHITYEAYDVYLDRTLNADADVLVKKKSRQTFHPKIMESLFVYSFSYMYKRIIRTMVLLIAQAPKP